ncbi:ATP/GTP-binding protein [Campylobacter mucosalis]|uniref:Invasion antigen I n=1 Tax=Campylobacter mucosalis CCUG 21559 TaxID=1032067 RepID=A0A6G5QEU7_9BACT|nr:ATP/GTP-binding protein [Campylobacter mucosalis]QCD44215.1 hypothetical protein CMUC_0402 [Campylobacter mucosalis CCUG 21559]
MKANLYSQSSYNNLDFAFKTSSGDKINLSMYDNKSVQMSSVKTQNSSTQAMTLTHEYGYQFEYSGNGLDANDIKEINEALKKIKPQIDEFMKSVDEGNIFSNNEISNFANELKKNLPQAKDLNHANAIADNALKMFDEMLEQHKAGQKLLEKTKKLFDDLMDSTNKFSFYV